MPGKNVKRRTTLKMLGSATVVSGTALGSKRKQGNEFAGVAYDMKTGEVLNEMTAEITKRRTNLEGQLRFDRTPIGLETNSLPLNGAQLLGRQAEAFPTGASVRFDREVGKSSFSDFRTTVAKSEKSGRPFPVRIQASSVDHAGVSGVIKPTPDHTDRFGFLLEPVTGNERKSHVVEDVRSEITGKFSGGDR